MKGLKIILQAAAILLGIASVLVFARDGLHFFVDQTLSYTIIVVDGWLGLVLDWPPIRSVLQSLLAALQSLLGIEFDLQLMPHWKQAFVLMWLLLRAFARATSAVTGPWTSAFRFANGFVCATAAGLMAGTVDLAHPGIFFWPLAGFFFYLYLNCLWAALPDQPVGRRLLTSIAGIFFGFLALICAVFAANFMKQETWGGVWSPSPWMWALAALVTLVALFSLFIAARGPASAGEHWFWRSAKSPGGRMGLEILAVLGSAALIASISQGIMIATAQSNGTIEADGAFRDCPDCPRMLPIPEGSLVMGSPSFLEREREDAHQSIRVQSFAMGATEVTRAQFAAFVAATGFKPSGLCMGTVGSDRIDLQSQLNWRNPGFPQDGDHPVVCVSWWEARAYAHWLSLTTGSRYRLPSESEWEYAARSGSAAINPWGSDSAKACSHANGFDEDANRQFGFYPHPDFISHCRDGYVQTAPVARFAANRFRLHDMLGNASEWTEDCMRPPTPRMLHPVFPDVGGCWRIVRGGSWLTGARLLRSSDYLGADPSARSQDLGFRLVKTL